MEKVGFKDGLLVAEGEKWGQARRVIAPIFSKKRSRDYLQDIWNEAEIFTTTIIADGKTVSDFLEMSVSFTSDVIGKIAFGFSEKDDSSYFYSIEFKRDLKHLLNFVTQENLSGVPNFLWPYSQYYKYEVKAMEAKARVEEVGLQILMKERLKPHNGTFIQALIKAEGESRFSDAQVLANIFTLFVAGSETTSIGICWTLYFLSQAPDVLTNLRSEVDQIFATNNKSMNSSSNKEDIYNGLRLCKACFIEAMRLKGQVGQIFISLVDKSRNYILKSGRIIRPSDKVMVCVEYLKFFQILTNLYHKDGLLKIQ
jgi:cytochrome P450